MFLIGFLIGGLIMTRIISLIIEVPTALITFFVSRKRLLLAPLIAAVLTFIVVAVIYAVLPVRDKSLSTGNSALELSMYAVCIAIWLAIDLAIVALIKKFLMPNPPQF